MSKIILGIDASLGSNSVKSVRSDSSFKPASPQDVNALSKMSTGMMNLLKEKASAQQAPTIPQDTQSSTPRPYWIPADIQTAGQESIDYNQNFRAVKDNIDPVLTELTLREMRSSGTDDTQELKATITFLRELKDMPCNTPQEISDIKAILKENKKIIKNLFSDESKSSDLQLLVDSITTLKGKKGRLGTLRRFTFSIRDSVRKTIKKSSTLAIKKMKQAGDVDAVDLMEKPLETIDFSEEIQGALDSLFKDFASSSTVNPGAKNAFDTYCQEGNVNLASLYLRREGRPLLRAAIGTQKTTNIAEAISKQVMTKLEGAVITRDQTIEIPVISAGVLGLGVGLSKGTAVSVKEGTLTLETTRGIKTTAKIGVDGALSLNVSLTGEQSKRQEFDTKELKTELMDAAKSTIIKLLTRTMGDKIDLSELKAAKSMMSSGSNSASSIYSRGSRDIREMESRILDGSQSLINAEGTEANLVLMHKEAESEAYGKILGAIERYQSEGPRAADAKTTYKTTFEVAVNSFGGNLTGKLTVSKQWNGDRQLSFKGVVTGQSLVVRHTKGVGGSTVDIETDLSASRLKSIIEERAGGESPQSDDSGEVKDFEGLMSDLSTDGALDEGLESKAHGRLEEERGAQEDKVVTERMKELGLEPGQTGKTYLKVGGKYVKICTFDLEDEAGTPVRSSVLGNLQGVYADKTNIHKKSNIKYTGKAGLDQAIKTLKYEVRNKRGHSFVEEQSLFFDTITKRATSSDAKERARFETELEGLGLSDKFDELQALASSARLDVPGRNKAIARILLESSA